MIRQRLFPPAFNLVVSVMSSAATSDPMLRDVAWLAGDTTRNVQNNEPSIAVNPANPEEIAIVAFSGNWDEPFVAGTGGGGDLGEVAAPVWKSRDGGKSWHRVAQIFAPQLFRNGPADQNVAFDRNGNLYVVALGVDPMKNFNDYVYRPGPGGADAPMVAGPSYGDAGGLRGDQPLLAIDEAATSSCADTIYLPFTNTPISGSSPTSRMAISTTHPSTLDHATTVDPDALDSSASLGTRVALASDATGRAYALYQEVENPGSSSSILMAKYMVRRSDSCGGWTPEAPAWTDAVSVTRFPVSTYFTCNFADVSDTCNVADVSDFPNRISKGNAWIAVAPDTGEVYVSYVQVDASASGAQIAQIYVARSTPGGEDWTPLGRITADTYNSAFPEIAVAGSGAVGVLYVDYDPDTGEYRHHLARSFNRGTTWTDEILQSMNPRNLSNALVKDPSTGKMQNTGLIWGDYEGLTAAWSKPVDFSPFGVWRFYGVFTGHSMCTLTCRPHPQLDPIFFTEKATPWSLLYAPNIINLCQIWPCTIPRDYIEQGDPCGFCGVVVFEGEILGANEEKGVVRTLFVSRGSSIGIVGATDVAKLSIVESAPGVQVLKTTVIRTSKKQGHLVGLALDAKGRLSGTLYTGRSIPLRVAVRAGFTGK